jgi:hypothetical protein
MASLDFITQLFQRGKRITDIFTTNRNKAIKWQENTLRKMLYYSRNTEYGKKYGFEDILLEKDITEAFRKKVPLTNYSTMHPYWTREYAGESNITWPGRSQHYALSSGTTEGASKYIPVSKDQLKAMLRGTRRQLLAMALTDIPKEFLAKQYLLVGGSTSLNFDGVSYSGDLSGICTANIPTWFDRFSMPGEDITAIRDWEEKVQRIVEEAPNWDIVFIAGAPSWVRLLLDRIIIKYNLKTIHDIWPNFSIYCWGAVSLAPYKHSIEEMLGKPVIFMEAYMASEGYIAFQVKPESEGMRLIFRNNTYFEFVPFNSDNFDENNELKSSAKAIGLETIDENTDYAILITTPCGAWRYLLGDTIRFTDKEACEIKITGRTKQFLSITGEHLSVDNMMHGLQMAADEMHIDFPEFTVKGVKQGDEFAHNWFVACNQSGVDSEILKNKLDGFLRKLNDDYDTERNHVLTGMNLTILPESVFIDWMAKHNKLGGQSKFPRVLADKQYEDWVAHVEDYLSKPN